MMIMLISCGVDPIDLDVGMVCQASLETVNSK